MERFVEVRSRSAHMWQGHVFEVCERVSEAQAILYNHVADGKLTAEEVVEKLHALLSEEGLSEAMRHIGYFPKKQLRPPS
jgi:hypothetical protein